jgi:hypothetical protein
LILLTCQLHIDYTVNAHNVLIFNKSQYISISVPSLRNLLKWYPLCSCAKNKPAMDNIPANVPSTDTRRYVMWKICIPRNTRMYFLWVFIVVCHFQLLQPQNKLHKMDMSCLAHHLDIIFGLKWTRGFILYASYILHMFIYT